MQYCHNSSNPLDEKKIHICTDSCVFQYFKQSCADICGIAVILGICIAAYEPTLFKSLTNRTEYSNERYNTTSTSQRPVHPLLNFKSCSH